MLFGANNLRVLISIHAPRTGSDPAITMRTFRVCYFNPRSPHGERPEDAPKEAVTTISIHAPRTGSDARYPSAQRKSTRFQSTLPARGATGLPGVYPPGMTHFNPRSPHGERRPSRLARLPSVKISIHAPRTGSDVRVAREADVAVRISIHAPRTGSDLQKKQQVDEGKIFQSTLPARGATRRG